jgi:hypothetical protein
MTAVHFHNKTVVAVAKSGEEILVWRETAGAGANFKKKTKKSISTMPSSDIPKFCAFPP